ncbi:MAG: M28 family peptidase [Planctomycetes bacterium]|nr:M28 family peptidase [Planctomycetota bacterium]
MLAVLSLTAALQLAAPASAAPPQGWPHPPPLSPQRLQADLRFLASDELGGRETGSFGAAVAADWIESRFRQLGLEPLAGSYRLGFPASPLHLDPDRTRLTVLGRDGAEDRAIQLGADFLPHPTAPAGSAEGEVVFAGYAIQAPEFEYDDLGGLDLRGKVALVLRWEPGPEDKDSPFEGTRMTRHATLAAKVRACQERGAVAVLVAPPPLYAKEPDAPGAPFWPAYSPFFQSLEGLVERQISEKERSDGNLTPRKVAEQIFCTLQVSAPLGASLPVALISRRQAEKLVRAGGGDLRRWVQETEQAGSGDGFPLGQTIRLEVGLLPARVQGWDIAGLLPGSDPELRDQLIVVGAHYDHVGSSEDGRIWNGADDNGSGSCGLLGIAEAFAWGGEPPRRSVLFLAFSGEELGLLGASWFLASGVVDPRRIKAMVNLDMIGRSLSGSVHVLGSKSAGGLAELVGAQARGLELRHDFENEQFFDRSDQAPFYFQRVPVLFFNTDEHPDYHKPSDTWDKIDYRTTANIAVLAWRVVKELADTPTPPRFEDGYRRLSPRFGSRPDLLIPFPVSFEDRLDY